MKAKLLQGNNRLRVCPATMQAVVQAWLDEELASPVEVVGVTFESVLSVFEISIKRTQEGPEA